MKKIFLILTVIVIASAAAGCACGQAEDTLPRYRAQIIALENDEIKAGDTGETYPIQYMTVRILEGPYRDMEFETEVFIDTTAYETFDHYRNGDIVEAELTLDASGEPDSARVTTLIRIPYIIGLAAVFLLLLVVIGRFKGLKTVASLVVTVGAVVAILVPLIAEGRDPILSAAFTSIIVTVFTMFLVGGFNKKSVAAMLGTISGLIIAAAVTLIAGALMRVTGIETEEVGMLMVSDVDFAFDFKGILTAGIIIGCLGAVMDVGMSISSSINELHEVNRDLTAGRLFKSGMAVGRDIMGTMANTLILSYTGGALMLMVVWSVYGVSFLDMLNKGYIVVEVIKALCGSIAMVLTIPLTALIASRMVHAGAPKNPAEPETDPATGAEKDETD